jgi:acyl-CoA reductase-like NAD-dependent aldehyde dehydrogenase
MKSYKLFINNEWHDASDKGTFETINPATGEVIANCAAATEEDVEKAVDAARKAFDEGPWPKMSALERGRVLRKISEIMNRRLTELALTETLDVGKPIIESQAFDIPMSVEAFEFYGNFICSIKGESIPAGDALLDYTIKEPIGVVGAITPWNFPLAQAVRKVAPALAAGNTIVLKPATATPLTTILLGEIVLEAGLPAGALNIVTGRGSVVGDAITNSKKIDKFSFTGSTDVGTAVMKNAAEGIRSVSLELGGKSPAIIFKDADLDLAAKAVLFGVFLNQGECCCGVTRVLIDRTVHDAFMAKFVPMVKKIRVGPGEDPSTQLGPMVTKAHQDTVLAYIDQGVKEGAKLIYGGNVKLDNKLEKGFYVLPTVFDDVKSDMVIYREEIFGPVVAVSSFDTEDELIEAANDTEYGLAASVYTTDLSKGHIVARKLKAGTVWINIHNYVLAQAPYGGYKQSGVGRELGKEGLEEYMETKNVITWLAPSGFSWYE